MQTLVIIVTWCLKITEKVSFNIASEARYAYNCRGQKFIENVQKVHIDADESAEVQFGNEIANQK